ncbi:MAG: 3-methyl-2-oxobutanoate dehydrogenase subunit VorB [Candidatus Omnitrophota bacterium]
MARKILMCGNEACGEGAVAAGCDLYAGYPITPQNELTAYLAKRMPEAGKVFIQSESEIAAINMVFGASVIGARAMTSSSSPGISLKQEGISYLFGCELPAVVVNVQRGGPGLGNISPSQADYFQATKGGGHGDYHMITLAPASVQEMFEFTYTAFDLADKYRGPVMILADGLLGQMMEPVDIRLRSEPRKTAKPWALTGCKGRPPNIIRSLYLGEGVLERQNIKLQEKFKFIKKNEVRCETCFQRDSDIVLIAYGSIARIARSCMEKARKSGIKVGLVRPISLWPFPSAIIRELSEKRKRFLVVEMSAGQMLEDVLLAVEGRTRVEFFGKLGGAIPQEYEITAKIRELAGLGAGSEVR